MLLGRRYRCSPWSEAHVTIQANLWHRKNRLTHIFPEIKVKKNRLSVYGLKGNV